jgi:hypothetical protein
MSKIIMALLAATGAVGVAAFVGATAPACSTDTPNPTGCVAMLPDAGIVPNEVCAIAWSCSSDDQYYQLVCSSTEGNYSCFCTTNQTTDTQTIVVPPFVCQDMTSRPVASGCGWVITD